MLRLFRYSIFIDLFKRNNGIWDYRVGEDVRTCSHAATNRQESFVVISVYEIVRKNKKRISLVICRSQLYLRCVYRIILQSSFGIYFLGKGIFYRISVYLDLNVDCVHVGNMGISDHTVYSCRYAMCSGL